jgi:hypothetical protein
MAHVVAKDWFFPSIEYASRHEIDVPGEAGAASQQRSLQGDAIQRSRNSDAYSYIIR